MTAWLGLIKALERVRTSLGPEAEPQPVDPRFEALLLGLLSLDRTLAAHLAHAQPAEEATPLPEGLLR